MIIYSFWFDVHREYISRARHTKYYLERDNKHTYSFCIEYYFTLASTEQLCITLRLHPAN